MLDRIAAMPSTEPDDLDREPPVLFIRGPIAPGDVPGLCARLRTLLAGGGAHGSGGSGQDGGTASGGSGRDGATTGAGPSRGSGQDSGTAGAGQRHGSGENSPTTRPGGSGAPRATEVICDVGALADFDAGTVDALARLQLTARRMGAQLRVRHATPGLGALIAFCGLSDVVPLVQPVRQPEQREHARRVEERVEPRDPPV